MRLNARLSLLFLLLTIFPVFLVGYLSFQNSRESIRDRNANHLISTNLLKKKEFERWIQGNALTLEILAKSPFFRETFPLILAAYLETDTRQWEAHRQIMDYLLPVAEGGEISELFVLRASDGQVLISTNAWQEGKFMDDRPYFIRGKTGTFIQNVYYSMTTQQVAMTISTPLRDASGNTIAVLAGRLDLSILSGIMKIQSGLRRTEDTYLVNKFNFFITEPKFGEDYALKKSVHTEAVRAALSGGEGVATYPDYRGVMVVGAYKWLPKWELCLITEMDLAEAFDAIYSLKNKLLGIAAVIALFSALMGWLSAYSVTKPLRELVKTTETIGMGNLDVSLNPGGSGEVADLARAFDRMIQQLNRTLVSRDALCIEIQERKRAEGMREQALAELKRSNADLQQFAYVASHDLQEPLRMVSSYTQLLAQRYENALDEKAKKYIHYAVDGATRMQHLIQDLLAYSRVTTQGEKIAITDSQQALASAITSLTAAIAETGAGITHDPLPTVRADAMQLTQIFQNLIGNAIKFHGGTAPRIHISALKDGGWWRFSIADNGIGIDAKYTDKIFVVFQRLHTRSEYPGTGIGLSLCKRIVERHGGNIWFESQPGCGTTFYFTLPEK
jgi:signal transduction histidine kinase